jgi:putative hydrolase of the HAD superfamily
VRAVIRAVLFDVAGVLTAPIGPAFATQAQRAGLDLLELQGSALAAFAAPGDSDLPAHRIERGEISLAEFLDGLDPADRASRLLMDPASPYFVPTEFGPSEAMHAFVREVRASGRRTAVVSNVVHEWVPWWEATIPVDEFDTVVYSCSVGLRKPNPAIYYHALVQLGVEPHEALFLDDFEAMVTGARSIGMHAVHVQDQAAAITEARAVLGL